MSNLKEITASTASMSHLQQPENCYEHEKIESHPAWHGHLDMDIGSKLLEHKAPFSYIFSALSNPNRYLLSYVREDRMVTHVVFTRGDNCRNWEYRNGDTHTFETLGELVCKAMHCEPKDCCPLPSIPKSNPVKA